MLSVLTLVAVAIGLVCGRLYSFIAVLLTCPLLALVAFVAATGREWTFAPALLAAIGTVGLAQFAFLAGARLRVDHALREEDRLAQEESAKRRNSVLPGNTVG